MKTKAPVAKPRRIASPSVGRAGHLRPLVLPALILIGALILRTVSLTTFQPLGDEQITRDVATGIWHGELSNNWKYTVTQPEFRIDMYNFSSYLYADALTAGAAAKIAALVTGSEPDWIYWSRLLSALAGALAIGLFYLVARQWFPPGTAITAMCLIAVMPLLVQDSHYARPEAFVVALTAVAYVLLSRFDSYPSRPVYLEASAFCFGLLIACKVSMIPMALLPGVFLLRLKDRRLAVRLAGICAACTLMGAFLGAPHAFFHPSAYLHGVDFLRKQYASAFGPHASADSNYSFGLVIRYFAETTGILLPMSLAGAFALARTRRFAMLALFAAPAAFYLVYFSLQRTFFERNLSHIAPLLAVLAAVGLSALGEKFPLRARTPALVAMGLLTAAPAAWASSTLVFRAMRGTNVERARSYEDSLQISLHKGLDGANGLINGQQLESLVKAAGFTNGELLIRLVDYHDSFTKMRLAELERRTNTREVGYFPSLFEGYSVNTMIAYHSESYRYLLLLPPSPAPGAEFVRWLRAGEAIPSSSTITSSWTRVSIPAALRLPGIHTGFYSSGTDGRNTGSLEFKQLDVHNVAEIGIPIVVGANNAAQSLTIVNHGGKAPIIRLSPLPPVTGWHLLRIDLASQHPSEIDVLADDEGSGPGEWMALGAPVTLQPIH